MLEGIHFEEEELEPYPLGACCNNKESTYIGDVLDSIITFPV